MNSLTFDHVAVPVTDARVSRAFYEQTLGLTLVDAMSGDDWDGRAWLLMFFKLPDGRLIALTAFRGVAPLRACALPTDARHYALATQDLKSWRTRFEKLAVPFREEDHGAQQSLFVEDPDGNVWELTSPRSAELFTVNSEADAIVTAWVAD